MKIIEGKIKNKHNLSLEQQAQIIKNKDVSSNVLTQLDTYSDKLGKYAHHVLEMLSTVAHQKDELTAYIDELNVTKKLIKNTNQEIEDVITVLSHQHEELSRIKLSLEELSVSTIEKEDDIKQKIDDVKEKIAELTTLTEEKIQSIYLNVEADLKVLDLKHKKEITDFEEVIAKELAKIKENLSIRLNKEKNKLSSELTYIAATQEQYDQSKKLIADSEKNIMVKIHKKKTKLKEVLEKEVKKSIDEEVNSQKQAVLLLEKQQELLSNRLTKALETLTLLDDQIQEKEKTLETSLTVVIKGGS